MFGISCPHCGEKIKKNFEYCPHCSANLSSQDDSRNYGLMGKSDNTDIETPEFNNSLFHSFFKRAMKELPNIIKMMEKQMQENDEKQKRKGVPTGLSMKFFVNGQRVYPQKSSPSMSQQMPTPQTVHKKMPAHKPLGERAAKLPRKEPTSKMRRIGTRLIYELSVPGVQDIEDVIVNQLESSIEIKALAQDKVYNKTLKVKLPILRYGLSKGNLLLELQAE